MSAARTLDRPERADEHPYAPGMVDPADGLPQSLDLEQALLGACLLNPEALDLVIGKVEAIDFYEPAHQAVFEAMRRRREQGGQIDHRLVAAALGPDAETMIGDLTARQYVARLAADATSVVNAPEYAKDVRDLSDLRRIIGSCQTAIEDSMARRVDPRAVVDLAISEMDAIAIRRRPENERQVSAGEAVSSALEAMRAVKEKRASPGAPTGVRDLDRALGGGLRKGQFVVVAGRPGMGKTTFATSILSAACRQDFGCYFVSLEMTDEEIGARLASAEAMRRGPSIPYNTIRSGKAAEGDEIESLATAAQAIATWPVRIEQQPSLTIAQIAARARLVANRFRSRGRALDVIIIDHMGLIAPSGRYSGSVYAETTEISKKLKALAKELDVALVALCQLSRQVEARTDKRPQLSDLRDSGSIEQDADIVLFAYREAYYLERDGARGDREEHIARLIEVQDKLELIIGKQRMGPTRTVDAYCTIGCNFIADLEQRAML